MKHKHYDVIEAFISEGKTIQLKSSNTDWTDYTSCVFPDFNNNDIEWRIKPETQKTISYRLALVDIGIGEKPLLEVLAFNVHEGVYYEEIMPPRAHVIKWLTDWIELEIE